MLYYILGILGFIAALEGIFLDQGNFMIFIGVFICVLSFIEGYKQKHPKQSNNNLSQHANFTAKETEPPKPTSPTAPIMPEPEPIKEPTPARSTWKPKGKYVTSLTFKVAGVTFDCECGFGTRQDALALSDDSDVLRLEPYTYKGKPAFYIINERLICDIGNVPATHTDQIHELYENYDLVGKFTKLDSFEKYPKDEDGDPDYSADSEITYFARVQFKAYEKSP